ncbi:hypothetical protein C8A03DRAFT_35797 [Achaetomium macrosporum]|uniref:Uncharacterized protein n=1 Tax=Achaetomium macrosporum TaxID=79813 RepID=A0AAN7C6V6_9PEZI|nr:hypothetical protein C8A03DRAFT_35797 [Achaetomium macrosporum]
MANTASGLVHSSSSPSRKTTAMDGEVLGLGYQDASTAGTNELGYPVLPNFDDMSQGSLSLSFSDSTTLNTGTPFNGSVWPSYQTVSTDDVWLPLDDGSQTLGSYEYDSVPPMSPSQLLLDIPWSPPPDQPLPSPLSEPPSYALSGGPLMGDVPSYSCPSPLRAPTPVQLTSSSQPSPPATTLGSSTTMGTPQQTLTPASKVHKRKAAHTKTSLPSLKRSAESTLHPQAAAAARPQVLKRYKSDSTSITLSSLTMTNNNHSSSTATTPTPRTPTAPTPRTPLTTATTTATRTGTTGITTEGNKALGGVLPANVDPRLAAEQIRRAAWERCRAETHEMSERRRMLLDHEDGALEREMQRLQVNLGRMREAARELEREEEDELEGNGGGLDGGELDEEGEEGEIREVG